MISSFPSIFNDVIGPLMRGPSSSHTAASVRIGKMVRQILNSKPVNTIVEFDINGSLATTHSTQGSDFGLAAGLIGVFITRESTFAAEECGCQAECGSASGMAAAGLVQLMNGTVDQALAGVDHVIPLDEVIQAMDTAGRMLPYELYCTGLGGLSITPTSKRIEKELNRKR